MSRIQSRGPLTISPTPFKSSFLAIPPSPFSPRTPLTPVPVVHKHTRFSPPVEVAPPASDIPPNPLAWIWGCHQCHRNYRLGVTRRCLDDGHSFCSGTVTAKEWRKRAGARRYRRHGACGSEFDYEGWKAWSRWRKDGQRNLVKELHKGSAMTKGVDPVTEHGQLNQGAKVDKNCWNKCSYPSECRWGRKFGVHSPVATEVPVVEFNTMPTLTAPIEQEGILKLENCKEADTCTGKRDIWDALVATAKRRTNVLSSSPLIRSAHNAERMMDNDDDGEIFMASVASSEMEPSSPVTSETPVPSSSSSSTTTSAAVDLFKEFMREKIAKRRRSFRSSGRGHRMFVSSFLTASRPTLVQQEGEEGEIDSTNAEAYLSEYASPGRLSSGDAVGVR